MWFVYHAPVHTHVLIYYNRSTITLSWEIYQSYKVFFKPNKGHMWLRRCHAVRNVFHCKAAANFDNNLLTTNTFAEALIQQLEGCPNRNAVAVSIMHEAGSDSLHRPQTARQHKHNYTCKTGLIKQHNKCIIIWCYSVSGPDYPEAHLMHQETGRRPAKRKTQG